MAEVAVDYSIPDVEGVVGVWRTVQGEWERIG